MADVYVFNCFNEPITGLSVAGYAAGNIAAYADGKTTVPIYTPSSLAVPRSKAPESKATFAIGDNLLVAPWVSFRGNATIKIPDPTKGVSLSDPLLLFLAVNKAILLTTRGYVLEEFPMTLTNQAGEAVQAPLA
jgi:hypothetical protein